MEDQNTFVATGRDLSRQDATDNDTDFSLSLEEVAERYVRAGHPRTLRSLQRYCVGGHLDARKIATTTGDKYLVTPLSVARHIAQIVELSQLDAVATIRDTSRQRLHLNLLQLRRQFPFTKRVRQRPTCRDRARQRARLLSWKLLFRPQVSDRTQRPHTTRRDRSRQNRPRQGR